MYGTIIKDAYTQKETIEIINALDELCNPNDTYGWASAGLYIYWDYYTKDLLYIGLTVDFKERFKQHNGFTRTTDSGSKYKHIKDYFLKNEKIGISFLFNLH